MSDVGTAVIEYKAHSPHSLHLKELLDILVVYVIKKKHVKCLLRCWRGHRCYPLFYQKT